MNDFKVLPLKKNRDTNGVNRQWRVICSEFQSLTCLERLRFQNEKEDEG